MLICVHTHTHTLHACLMPKKAKEGIRAPRTGVKDSCELSWGCWESNGGSLKKPQVLLAAGSSLQCLIPFLFVCGLGFFFFFLPRFNFFIYGKRHIHGMVHKWRSEDNLWESTFFPP